MLRYLKHTITHGISFTPNSTMKPLMMHGFVNADYASCPDYRRSIGAYFVYLDNNLISWRSKKQTIVARSSAESKYRALAHIATEITWLLSLLREIGVKLAYQPVIFGSSLACSESSLSFLHKAYRN